MEPMAKNLRNLVTQTNRPFLQKENRIFNTICFTVKILEQLLDEDDIELFYKEMSQLSQNHQINLLQNIPYHLLPAVKQFTGEIYNPKLVIYFSTDLTSSRTSYFSYEIVHINFPHLTTLDLTNLNILNIQALTFLQAPNLQTLILCKNKISNLNILNKADLKNLSTITFSHNPITQIELFYRLHSQKMFTYKFDISQPFSNRVEDYRFLFKMQSTLPKRVVLVDYKRVNIQQRPYFGGLYQQNCLILFQYSKPASREQFQRWRLRKQNQK